VCVLVEGKGVCIGRRVMIMIVIIITIIAHSRQVGG